MSINIQLDGCGTGASYCGPVELVAADRGPVCGCLLMFVTHHTLSRSCHEVAPPACCHVTRYSVTTVTPFVSHYITAAAIVLQG